MKIKLFTIPNLLTLSNLMCGSFAVVAALVYGDLTLAFWLVIVAAVFDFFDGFVARLMGISSPLGVQLDSLADMISFGLAPAAVLYVMYGQAAAGCESCADALVYGQYLVFILTAFSALRLGKFNIDETQHDEFEGLPTPACTLFCVSLGFLWAAGDITLSRVAILAVVAVMSFLLVSPIRMFALKFKGFGWRGNELRYSFIAVSVVLIALLQMRAVPVIILLYITASAVRWIVLKSRKLKTCAHQ